MVKITLINLEPHGSTLRIEGALDAAALDELRGVLQQSGPPRALDLTSLRGVDQAGAAVLASLARSGVAILGASPYLQHVVREAMR